MLHAFRVVWLAAAVFCAVPASAYTFFLDSLEIVHSGGTVFLDEFDDGLPPPSVGYNMQGTVGPEAGGVLTLDQSGAVPGAVAGSEVQLGIQLVNAPLSQDFTASVLYDLVVPDPFLIEGQAVFLAYVAPPVEVHTVIAAFQSTPTLPLALTLIDFDTVTAVPTVLDVLDVSSLITGNVDQVEVVLSSLAGSGTAEATINFYDGGLFVDTATLPTSAVLAGTVIPSSGFQVFVPEPGTAALFAGVATIAALSRRRRQLSRA